MTEGRADAAAGSDLVVFLHGFGDGPESWDAQLAALPDGAHGLPLRIPGLREGDGVRFALAGAASAVRDELDRLGRASAHLCGLSLGAMVATRFALDHPARTASLVLSGGQVRPNPVLMAIQNAVLRTIPERLLVPSGMSRSTVREVMREVARTDFGPEHSRIEAPTLVLCGRRDRLNLPAARHLAAGIPGAELAVVPRAGHQWNTRLPDEFSARLNHFLVRQITR